MYRCQDDQISGIFEAADKDNSKYLSQTEFIDAFWRVLLGYDDFGYVVSDDDDDHDDDDDAGGDDEGNIVVDADDNVEDKDEDSVM